MSDAKKEIIIVSFIMLFAGGAFFYGSDVVNVVNKSKMDEEIPSLNPEILLNNSFVAESHSESGYQMLYLDMNRLMRHWTKIDVQGNIVTGSVKTKELVEDNMQTSLVYDLVDKGNQSYVCMKRKEPLSTNFISNSFVSTVSAETGTTDFEIFGESQKRRALLGKDGAGENQTNTLEYAGKMDLLLPPEFYGPEDSGAALVNFFLFH